MIFKSISLENFGCIGSFNREFSRGILVLAGQNGMGKSTVLKAILLAVFDDYQGVLSDYVKWDAKAFRVAVCFAHKGVDYESIVRYDGTSERTLAFGGTTLKGDEAKRRLKEIVDADLLKAGMLSMEQHIAIVETKPAERREYLKRIYDIGFKRQLADMDEEIKSAQVEAAGKQSAVAEIEGRTYDVPSKPEYPFSKADYDLSKANLDIEQRKLHTVEEQTKERERLLKEKQSLTSEVASLTSSIEQLEVRIAGNEKAIGELPAQKAVAQGEYEKRIKQFNERLEGINAEYDKVQAELDARQKGIIPHRLPMFNAANYDSVSRTLYVKKAHLTELQNAKDVCPTCGQSISSPEHIARRKEEIASLEKEIASLTESFTSLSSAKQKREEVEANNREKEKERIAIAHEKESTELRHTSEVNAIQGNISSAQKELSWLDEKYKAKEESLRGLVQSDKENREGQTQRLDSTRASLETVKTRLESMHEEPIDGIKDVIARLEVDIKAWDDTASRIAEIERIEQRVAQQKAEDEKRLVALRGEIQALNQTIGDREEGIKIFKTEFPVYVISRVIRDIEKSMNDFLKRTYPKYTIQIQDKRNALHIVYGLKKRDVSSASGFERQIFSLSFMFAVSRVIGNRCMILDAADSSATDKNSEIFYRVLGDSIGCGIEQVILVSHKQSTRDILQFDYGADVVTFDNGVAF